MSRCGGKYASVRLPLEVFEVVVDGDGVEGRCGGSTELLLLAGKDGGLVWVVGEGYVRARDAPVYLFRQRLQALPSALARTADLACSLLLGAAIWGCDVAGLQFCMGGRREGQEGAGVEDVRGGTEGAGREVVEAAECPALLNVNDNMNVIMETLASSPKRSAMPWRVSPRFM
jgi:hypothetical protein